MKNNLKEKLIKEITDVVFQLEARVNIKTVVSNFNLCIEPLVGFDRALLLSDGLDKLIRQARKNKKEITIEYLLGGNNG